MSGKKKYPSNTFTINAKEEYKVPLVERYDGRIIAYRTYARLSHIQFLLLYMKN